MLKEAFFFSSSSSNLVFSIVYFILFYFFFSLIPSIYFISFIPLLNTSTSSKIVFYLLSKCNYLAFIYLFIYFFFFILFARSLFRE